MPIREKDVICFLQGASKPTIIRPCKNHFTVIMISVTLRHGEKMKSGYVRHERPSGPTESFLRDFLLVWNWEAPGGVFQDRAGYETSAEINTLVPQYLETATSKTTRFEDVILALSDANEFKGAENRLQGVVDDHKKAFGKENLHTLARMEDLAMLCKKHQKVTKAKNLLWQVVETRKRVQVTNYQDTLSSIANLVSMYTDPDPAVPRSGPPTSPGRSRPPMPGPPMSMPGSVGGPSRSVRLAAVTSLTNQIRDNILLTEESLAFGIEFFEKELVALLLSLKRENVPITEEVVKAAARRRENGGQIMKLLLDQRDDEIKITEEVIKVAAENRENDYQTMKLLLDKRGNEIKFTEEVLKAVAGNELSSVMKIILNRHGDEVKITEEVVKAAAGNQKNGHQIMKLLLDKRGNEIKITEEVLKAAAGNKVSDVMKMIIDQRSGDEIEITEKVAVAAITAGEQWGYTVFRMLIKHFRRKIKITEEIVKAAAGNRDSDAMEILFHRFGDSVRLTKEVVEVAAAHPNVMKCLRQHRGDEVKIYEEVVKEVVDKMAWEDALKRFGNI